MLLKRMESDRVRCRKCRGVLLSKDELRVLNAHGELYSDPVGSDSSDSECSCPSVKEHSCLYLSEECYPDFVNQAIAESSWTKGKIYCPSCQARLGSFNFVSGSQCVCGSFVLPQVHFLRSKVDWMKVGEALPHPVSFPSHSVALCASTLPLDQPDHTPSPPPPPEGVSEAADMPRSVRGLPGAPSDTSSDAHFSRSPKKKDEDVSRNPSTKVKRRRREREKELSEELSDGQTAKSSCFEVLESEMLESEDDSSAEEEMDVPDKLVCPVCLDVLYSPLVSKPCGHVFCEPCLRRMARPNPTSTHCPLCRRIIGQCMPCPELAHEVRDAFPDLYQKRRLFELQHNSHHLPLPWTKNFRLTNTHGSGESWVERAGGWRTILVIMSLNLLGAGIVLYLGREVRIQSYISQVNE